METTASAGPFLDTYISYTRQMTIFQKCFPPSHTTLRRRIFSYCVHLKCGKRGSIEGGTIVIEPNTNSRPALIYLWELIMKEGGTSVRPSSVKKCGGQPSMMCTPRAATANLNGTILQQQVHIVSGENNRHISSPDIYSIEIKSVEQQAVHIAPRAIYILLDRENVSTVFGFRSIVMS